MASEFLKPAQLFRILFRFGPSRISPAGFIMGNDRHIPEGVIMPDPVEESPSYCLNCGHEVEVWFCPSCGQSQKDLRVSFRTLTMDFLGDVFTFDSKLFRSLKPLFIKPGFLTKEFMEGKRVRYIPPLRMYIFTSILFFVTLNFTDQEGGNIIQSEKGSTLPREVYLVANNEAIPDQTRNEISVYIADYEQKQQRLAYKAKLTIRLNKLYRKRNAAADAISWTDEDVDTYVSYALDLPSDTLPDDQHLAPFDEKTREYLLREAKRYQSSIKDIEESKAKNAWDPPTEIHISNEDDEVESFMEKKVNGILREKEAKLSAMDEGSRARVLTELALDSASTVLFFLMPLFALFLKVVYIRRDPLYMDHLIFAFHFHAFLFLFYSILIWIQHFTDNDWLGVALILIAIFTNPIYLFLALKRVYQQGFIKTFIKFLIVNGLYWPVLLISFILSALLAFLRL